MKIKFYLLLMALAFSLTACYDDSEIRERVENLEDTAIVSINNQLKSMSESIVSMEDQLNLMIRSIQSIFVQFGVIAKHIQLREFLKELKELLTKHSLKLSLKMLLNLVNFTKVLVIQHSSQLKICSQICS